MKGSTSTAAFETQSGDIGQSKPQHRTAGAGEEDIKHINTEQPHLCLLVFWGTGTITSRTVMHQRRAMDTGVLISLILLAAYIVIVIIIVRWCIKLFREDKETKPLGDGVIRTDINEQVALATGENLEKQISRLSEILLGLATATIGAFILLILNKKNLISDYRPLFLLGMVFLAISVLNGLLQMAFLMLAMWLNPEYQKSQDVLGKKAISTDFLREVQQPRAKRVRNIVMWIQAISFGAGIVFLSFFIYYVTK